jgi:hypothetical protein
VRAERSEKSQRDLLPAEDLNEFDWIANSRVQAAFAQLLSGRSNNNSANSTAWKCWACEEAKRSSLRRQVAVNQIA